MFCLFAASLEKSPNDCLLCNTDFTKTHDIDEILAMNNYADSATCQIIHL